MGANGQGPPQPQLPQLAQANCFQCKNQFIVRVPIPRIINGHDFSNIVFVHANMDKCPHCGLEYIFTVLNIDQNGTLIFNWVPVKPSEQAIVPGTQKNLNEALQTDDVAKKIKLQ